MITPNISSVNYANGFIANAGSPSASSHFTFRSEVYDLLKANSNNFTNQSNDYYLKRPYGSILREVNFRSFKTTLKSNIQKYNRMSMQLTITPVLIKTNPDIPDDNDIVKQNFYMKYNDITNVEIKDVVYEVDYDGNNETLILDLKSCFDNYKSIIIPSDVSPEKLGSVIEYVTAQVSTRHSPFSVVIPSDTELITLNYNKLTDIITSNHAVFRVFIPSGGESVTYGYITFIFKLYSKPLYTFNQMSLWQLSAIIILVKKYLPTTPDISITPNIPSMYKFPEYIKNSRIANYLYNGLDLHIKSSLAMNNSAIIFAGNTEAQVMFKNIDVNPTLSSIPVRLTDKNNFPVDINVLREIFNEIILEIDFAFTDV